MAVRAPPAASRFPGGCKGRNQREWAKVNVPEPWLLHSKARGDAGSKVVSQTAETPPEAPANRPVPPVRVTVSSAKRVVRFNETEIERNS